MERKLIPSPTFVVNEWVINLGMYIYYFYLECYSFWQFV